MPVSKKPRKKVSRNSSVRALQKKEIKEAYDLILNGEYVNPATGKPFTFDEYIDYLKLESEKPSSEASYYKSLYRAFVRYHKRRSDDAGDNLSWDTVRETVAILRKDCINIAKEIISSTEELLPEIQRTEGARYDDLLVHLKTTKEEDLPSIIKELDGLESLIPDRPGNLNQLSKEYPDDIGLFLELMDRLNIQWRARYQATVGRSIVFMSTQVDLVRNKIIRDRVLDLAQKKNVTVTDAMTDVLEKLRIKPILLQDLVGGKAPLLTVDELKGMVDIGIAAFMKPTENVPEDELMLIPVGMTMTGAAFLKESYKTPDLT